MDIALARAREQMRVHARPPTRISGAMDYCDISRATVTMSMSFRIRFFHVNDSRNDRSLALRLFLDLSGQS